MEGSLWGHVALLDNSGAAFVLLDPECHRNPILGKVFEVEGLGRCFSVESVVVVEETTKAIMLNTKEASCTDHNTLEVAWSEMVCDANGFAGPAYGAT